jgi:hypothetical protein
MNTWVLSQAIRDFAAIHHGERPDPMYVDRVVDDFRRDGALTVWRQRIREDLEAAGLL